MQCLCKDFCNKNWYLSATTNYNCISWTLLLSIFLPHYLKHVKHVSNGTIIIRRCSSFFFQIGTEGTLEPYRASAKLRLVFQKSLICVVRVLPQVSFSWYFSWWRLNLMFDECKGKINNNYCQLRIKRKDKKDLNLN